MDNTNQQNTSQTPPPLPASQPVNPEQKPQTLIEKHGKLKVFIVAVIIVAIMEALAIYFLNTEADLKFFSMLAPTPTTQPSPTSKPSPTPTPSLPLIFPTVNPQDAKNWKTFTAPDKSFSFQYPSLWEFETEKYSREFYSKAFSSGKEYPLTYISIGEKYTEEQLESVRMLEGNGYRDENDINPSVRLDFGAHKDFEKLSLKDFIDEKAYYEGVQKSSLPTDNSILLEQYDYFCHDRCTVIVFKKDNMIFKFHSNVGFQVSADTSLSSLHKILSTFKFTE